MKTRYRRAAAILAAVVVISFLTGPSWGPWLFGPDVVDNKGLGLVALFVYGAAILTVGVLLLVSFLVD
jgi:hypothetical protein